MLKTRHAHSLLDDPAFVAELAKLDDDLPSISDVATRQLWVGAARVSQEGREKAAGTSRRQLLEGRGRSWTASARFSRRA